MALFPMNSGTCGYQACTNSKCTAQITLESVQAACEQFQGAIGRGTATTCQWTVSFGSATQSARSAQILQPWPYQTTNPQIRNYSCETWATEAVRIQWRMQALCHEWDWNRQAIWNLSAADRLREIIRARQSPAIILPGSTPILSSADPRELRARQTLRSVIGEEKYRRFVARGFLAVRGASGRTYQIFPGQRMTRVLDAGKPVEELCIVLSGDYPPTDFVLMRYAVLLDDEARFKRIANRWMATDYRRILAPENLRPLPEIMKRLRGAA